MEIVNKKISELKPYENNPRKNDNAVDYVAKSIQEFGFKVPIVIDKDGVIIAGHTRYKASEKLGLEEVPCIIADDLTEEQVKAFRLADNKVSEMSEWDYDLLNMELDDIIDIDMEDFGFLDLDTEEEKEVEEDDFNVEPPEEPKAKYGDIYQLGEHRLMCGDSTKEEDVTLLMNGNKADMVFTDPPYGVKYSARTGIRSGKIRPEMQMILNDDLEGADLQNFINIVIFNLKLFSKENAPFYICNNWHCFDKFLESFKVNDLELNAFIIWNKDWMSVGHSDYRSNHEFVFYSKRNSEFYAKKGTQNDVWTLRKLSPDKKIHTTEKPVGLSAKAVENSSKKENIVLDLFGGSGSTLIACEQLNRKCYMMELDPKYVDVIIERWEKFTGKKAVKIN